MARSDPATRHKMTGSTRTMPRTPDGRKIEDRQYNVNSPHPHPSQNGREVPTTGLNLVMLADGSTLYECDECGRTGDNSRSVISHFTAHNAYKSEPDYDVKFLRQLVLTAKKYRDVQVRNYAVRTAQELNDLGFKTRSGDAFTAEGVSHLYVRWKDDPRMRARRTAKKETSPVDRIHQPTGLEVHDRRSDDPLQVLADALDRLLTGVNAVREAVDAVTLGEHVDRAELEMLRDKARRWDDLRASLR